MTERTKKMKRASFLTWVFSFVATFGPLIYYLATSFAIVESTAKKCVLGVSFIVCAMLTMYGIIVNGSLRSPLFVLLLALYYVIGSIGDVIIAVSIGAILDEFIFSPLHRRYKRLKEINIEIDKRGSSE